MKKKKFGFVIFEEFRSCVCISWAVKENG